MTDRADVLDVKGCRRDLIGCQDCGHIFDKPACRHGDELSCQHCGASLFVYRQNWLPRVTALTLTGIILFAVTLSFPFLGLEAAGQTQASHLLSSVSALFEREQLLLGALICVTIFVSPLLELAGLSYVLASRLLNYRFPSLRHVLQLLFWIRPWNMMEILFLGMLVTTIKLRGLAELQIGIGVWAFAGLVIVLIMSHLQLSREDLWDWVKEENYYSTQKDVSSEHHEEELVSCQNCRALVASSLIEVDAHCPRCQASLHVRLPESYQRTLALLIAAAVLYIPANTLPIMTTIQFGMTTSNTIFSGVIHLLETGSVVIAGVVFVASMVVPIAKFLGMAYLLWVVKHPGIGNPRQQTALYRLIELVGRWSMVDVFVVALLVALVQFGVLTSVEPELAILCFGAVVVLTMVAAETFDPRLIWDRYHQAEVSKGERDYEQTSMSGEMERKI